MKKLTTFVVSLSIIGSFAHAEPYCLALRGNGEAQPAHWGALANVVEKMGLPEAQSGGSSASISMMLLESIAANPWVANSSNEEQKSRAAFLFKALHGVTIYLTHALKNKFGGTLDIKKALAGLAGTDQNSILGSLTKSDLATKLTAARVLPKVIETLKNIGVDENSHYHFLLQKLTEIKNGAKLNAEDTKKVKFYAEDLRRALQTFGAFDAESDPYLFFREGVVNFQRLGFGIGQISSFLSQTSMPRSSQNAFTELVNLCEPQHKNLTWAQLISKEPRCQSLIDKSLKSYFSQKIDWKSVNFAMRPVGSVIASFPTTAVLVKSAYQQAKATMDQYHTNLDSSAAEKFKLQDIRDVRLGYWGNPDSLEKMRVNLPRLFPNDAKSEMFLGLGQTYWLEVLRTSPAEPGLASFQPMVVNGERAFSAGGWSDLHPVLVLKAAGCDHVVYVTRKSGESLFAQGIAKRVLNLERSWEFLRTKGTEAKEQNKILNDRGDTSDLFSLWSRLYNLANPQSSFRKSVANADSILCTNWNDFDVKSQINELVEDSYRTPLTSAANLTGFPGCH